MRHLSLRRVIGCLVAVSLLASITACNDSSDSDKHNRGANATVEGVEPEAFVYQDQAFCVYPDDMDDLDDLDGVVNDPIVGAYCSEVYDSSGQAIPQERWIEADEVNDFTETDTSRATLIWIHYLTYLDDWFLSQMFINAYLTTGRDVYLAKQHGHQAKYTVYIAKYKPMGRYHTKTGVVVSRDQLGKYRIAPPSCKLAAFDGSGAQFVPAALAATPPKPKATLPKATQPKATQPKAVEPTKATNKATAGNKPTYTAPKGTPTRTC